MNDRTLAEMEARADKALTAGFPAVWNPDDIKICISLALALAADIKTLVAKVRELEGASQ